MAASPRPVLLWLALTALLLALALVLAAPVYHLLTGLGWLDGTSQVGGDAFGRVLRRLLLIAVAVPLLLLLKPWRDVGWGTMGLHGPAARPRLGLVLGAVSVLAVAAVLVAHVLAGWLAVNVDPPGKVTVRVLRALLTGVVVGAIEEWFFRAWLPVRLGTWLSPRWALTAALAVFAGAHAFRASHLVEPPSRDLSGALDALGSWLGTLFDPVAFGPAFAGLVLFGLILTLLYRRSGTLYAPIGVHAGCIVALQAYGGFTERLDTPRWAGTRMLYDGVPGLVLLALIALLLVVPRRGRSGLSASA